MTRTTETEAIVYRVERRVADRRAAAREVWVVVEVVAFERLLTAVTLFNKEADAVAFMDASTYPRSLRKETVH